MGRKGFVMPESDWCAMKIGEMDYILPAITVGDVTETASVTPSVTTISSVFNKIRSVTTFTPIFVVN